MSATALASAAPRGESPASTRRHRPRWLLRLPIALLLAAGGIALFVTERTMRGLEVLLTSHLLSTVFSTRTVTSESLQSPAVLFQLGGDWSGLRMTVECSIAFYVGAILLFGALMLLLPRFSMPRTLLATGVSAVWMVLLNQVRMFGLAWVLGEKGHDAFEWAHSLGGSILMLSGLAAALALFFVVVVRRSRKRA